MATPENKAKRKIKEWYQLNLPDHFRISPRGGPFGKQGASDDVICWLGFFIAIEVKSDDGELSAMQLHNLRLVQKAGGVAAVVKGYDVARLNQIKAIVQAKHNWMMAGKDGANVF